jgi:hypothetical protein
MKKITVIKKGTSMPKVFSECTVMIDDSPLTKTKSA